MLPMALSKRLTLKGCFTISFWPYSLGAWRHRRLVFVPCSPERLTSFWPSPWILSKRNSILAYRQTSCPWRSPSKSAIEVCPALRGNRAICQPESVVGLKHQLLSVAERRKGKRPPRDGIGDTANRASNDTLRRRVDDGLKCGGRKSDQCSGGGHV